MIIDGCSVTSNNVALVNYGTPYLDVQPSAVLCGPGDDVQLQVMTAPGSTVLWSPPIGGSALTVTITQPGTYSCSVTACGIVTSLSVVITEDPAIAAITTPGPYVLCEGDSVTLHAAAGNASYLWMPGSVSGADLVVTSAGSYLVIVENAGGCTDTSAVVVVDQVLFAGPLSISGDTVCAGDAAVLLSSGPGPVNWYGDAGFTSLLGSGPSLTFTPTVDVTVHARQEQSGCIGDSATAFVDVKPRPASIEMEGPTELCAGESLTYTVIAPDTVTLVWSTPQGPFSGDVLVIDPVTLANGGIYQCQATYDGCNTASTTRTLIVHAPQEPALPALTEFCLGSQASFTLPEEYSSVQWSTGSTASSITVGSSAVITVVALDINGCAVTGSLEVIAEDCPLLVPNVFSPNGDGVNDAWFPSGGFLQANAWIYGRWGNLVHEGDVMTNGWDGTHQRSGERCPAGVYYYVLDLPRADGTAGNESGHIQLVW
ncbi:MAG: gliding motility-associated C-terminal domain-containing protein [Flavobacteriales bacterium]|nr:gliding motility-associated C-terminal domain-containing protein [Flavobacteriales bacterium]